jgi:hypothetical protein
MSKELQAALSGAKREEYRLYKSPEGHFYVLYVQDVIPSSQQTFEGAKQDVAKKVFETRLKALVDDWVGNCGRSLM